MRPVLLARSQREAPRDTRGGRPGGEAGNGGSGMARFPPPASLVPFYPSAIVAKKSRLFFVRSMRLIRNSIASVSGMSPRKLRSR